MKHAFKTSIRNCLTYLCIAGIITALALPMPVNAQVEIRQGTTISAIHIYTAKDGATANLNDTNQLIQVDDATDEESPVVEVTEDTYIAVGKDIWIEVVFAHPGIDAATETPAEGAEPQIDAAAAALELRLDLGGPVDSARGRDYLKPAVPYPDKPKPETPAEALNPTYTSIFYKYTVQAGDQDLDGGWFDETPFRGGKLYTEDNPDDADAEPEVLVDFDGGQQLAPFTGRVIYPKIGTEITDINIYIDDVQVNENGQRVENSGTPIINEDTTVPVGEDIWIEIAFSIPLKLANAAIRAAFDRGGPYEDTPERGRGYLGPAHDYTDVDVEGGYPTLLYKYTVQEGDMDLDGGWMDETPFEWGHIEFGGGSETTFRRHGQGVLLPPYTKRIYYPTIDGTVAPVPFDGIIDLSTTILKNEFLVVHPFSLDTGGLEIRPSQSLETDGEWENLEVFFRNSGTIELLAPRGAGIKERAVVISEVMWGLDAAATPETASQWIELYNMGFSSEANPVSLGGWKLHFVEGDFIVRSEVSLSSGDYDVIDQVSNAGFGWNSFVGNVPGQNGRSERGSLNNQDVKAIISMYREIDYDTAERAGATDEDKFTAAKDGTNGANWSAAAPPSKNLADPRVGTPGEIPPPQPVFDATPVPRTPVIFNEIGNANGSDGDWIELRNVTNREVNVGKWEISLLNANKRDVRLAVIPEGEEFVIPARGVLLIVATPPEESRLARGIEFGVDAREIERAGLAHLYHVADESDDELALPDTGKYLLILRSESDKRATHEAIIDVAGNYFEDRDADTYRTKVWPLHGTLAPRANDKEEDLDAPTVWRRANPNRVGYHKDAWREAAWTGLGYDRAVKDNRANGGTPGYPNDAVKNRTTEFANDVYVTISEVMFASGDAKLPQWIELYNSSETQAVNLKDWRLDIENYDSEDLGYRLNATLILGEKTLYPNQTLLIVSRRGQNSEADHFPNERIYNLWANAEHRKELQMVNQRDPVLSEVAFSLRLSDSKQVAIDVVGNLDGNKRTRNDKPAWDLPSGWTKDGERQSMIRRYVQGTRVALDGTEPDGWIPAAATKFRYVPLSYFYGHVDDLGTPLFRSGGPLPVELEHFGVSRWTQGGVVLTWATASEMDNAGFNILRREGREGVFRVVTPVLIPGAGTTGERSTYTFTDNTAKVGVLYFYQIEEVSFDGTHQVLATRRMKGHVTPAHRALTTFGEVKKGD